MTARVRVGVRRVMYGREVEEPEQVGDAEVFLDWVELNALRLDSDEYGIISAIYKTDARAMATVTIELATASYESVDHRVPPPDQTILTPALSSRYLGEALAELRYRAAEADELLAPRPVGHPTVSAAVETLVFALEKSWRQDPRPELP